MATITDLIHSIQCQLDALESTEVNEFDKSYIHTLLTNFDSELCSFLEELEENR